jgi:hypothetical protein
MTLELTKDEARALMGLLDVAVKAGGLQVAQAALPLAVKVQQALDAPEPEPEPE